jgi:hypothetical protein
MLQLQLIHIAGLIVLLAPGVVAGTIVTWKIRSPWALFVTIGFSLVGSFVIAISTMLFGKLLSPILVNLIGPWAALIDFIQAPVTSEFGWYGALPSYIFAYMRLSLVSPIGTVAGATLSGMLMVVRYKLLREGGKFEPSYAWVAGFGSAVVGGILGVFSILMLCWLGWQGILFIHVMFGNDLSGADSQFVGVSAQLTAGFLVLLNGLVCGFISAVCGIKTAKILM